MIRLFSILLISIVVSISSISNAQTTPDDSWLDDVGIVEKLGDYVPLDLEFVNEEGETVTLQSYFDSGRPVLLNLIYFRCPSICSVILNGVADGVKDLRWTPGVDYDIITVSIDHEEDHILAAENKQSYIEFLDRPGAEDGWHFLTGTEENIRALSDAVGYNFIWSDEAQEYLHGAGIMFLSPEGRVTRYLYGAMYRDLDLRNALFDAADGRIGSTAERIALFCFTYDPDSRSYVPYAMNIMKVGGAVILLGLSVFLGFFWLKERKKTDPKFS